MSHDESAAPTFSYDDRPYSEWTVDGRKEIHDCLGDRVFPYGTQFKMSYIWGYGGKGSGPGQHKDIYYTTTEPNGECVYDVVEQMTSLIQSFMEKQNTQGRHYFVEGIKIDDFGDVEFALGT